MFRITKPAGTFLDGLWTPAVNFSFKTFRVLPQKQNHRDFYGGNFHVCNDVIGQKVLIITSSEYRVKVRIPVFRNFV